MKFFATTFLIPIMILITSCQNIVDNPSHYKYDSLSFTIIPDSYTIFSDGRNFYINALKSWIEISENKICTTDSPKVDLVGISGMENFKKKFIFSNNESLCEEVVRFVSPYRLDYYYNDSFHDKHLINSNFLSTITSTWKLTNIYNGSESLLLMFRTWPRSELFTSSRLLIINYDTNAHKVLGEIQIKNPTKLYNVFSNKFMIIVILENKIIRFNLKKG